MRNPKIFIALTILFFGFHTSSGFSSEPETLEIDGPAYLTSGLPNFFPATFVFDQNRHLLVLAASENDGAKLDAFFDGKLPPPPENAAKQAALLDKLLTAQGTSLEKIVSTSKKFTLVEVGFDAKSCPPCQARHQKISDKLSGKNPVDAQWVSILVTIPQ